MEMDIVDQIRGFANRYQELLDKWNYYQNLCRIHGANGIGDLLVQRDAYKTDAERYRWLLKNDLTQEKFNLLLFRCKTKEQLDAAIDSAIKASHND